MGIKEVESMQGYIDIHSHILPGVDDGARDMNQTRHMLQLAYQEGIRFMIATPHYEIGCSNMEITKLREVFEQVSLEAHKINKDFQIALGNELFFSMGIIEALQRGEALTIAGTRYILVEFEPNVSYRKIQESLHHCVIEGYIPILAHVERYHCLVEQPNYVEKLIAEGAYIQMNLSSIRGGITSPKANFCKKLLRQELVHFLGTDSHDTAVRAPNAKETVNYLVKKYGEVVVQQLLWDNPRRMLENKHL